MVMIINETELRKIVPTTDAYQNRRILKKNPSERAATGSYHTSDNPEKRNRIHAWFNYFDQNNVFYINVTRTSEYIRFMQDNILNRAYLFQNQLNNIEEDIASFRRETQNTNQLRINNLELTGANDRYLTFPNPSAAVKAFRNLVFGDRITHMVFKKNNENINEFEIYLEFATNWQEIIEEAEDYVASLEENGNPIGYNRIYHGVPGCGKSHYVKQEYEKEENIFFRTTFHPEYSYSDFVGQILPKVVNSQPQYSFFPGPFSSALQAALKNEDKKVILIIEEINRGNAAAIFGEVFQLLDRKADGTSEYPIKMPAVTAWLKEQQIEKDDISIPANLFIVATMNTSDQNVFTLDTAFKRRWEMVALPNDFPNGDGWFNNLIPGSNITWKTFVETINNKILENNFSALNNEDKRLGVYFVGENELIERGRQEENPIKRRRFANKILMYLWEDVTKLNRSDWFNEEIHSLEQLIERFVNDTNNSLNVLNIDFPNENNGPEN